MRQSIFLCFAVALCFAELSVAIAEEGKWELEQRRTVVLTLSYKQSATINHQTETSELALLCDQRDRTSLISAILIPFDGTFESHLDLIPVSIQKQSGQAERSDLMQNWKNGGEFLYLYVAKAVAELIAFLKEKDAASNKSVHLYFTNGHEDGQQRSNHLVIDASGFADKFKDFEKGCASPQ